MGHATRVAAAVLAAASVLLTGCKATNEADQGPGHEKLTVVATTGYLGDAARNIAPDAEVTVLVGPGGDPHTQSLTTGDAQRIDEADVVVWTSHDMEHQMMDQLDGLGDKQVPAAESIPEEELLPWEEDGKVQGHDPHVWNSPESWTHVVDAIAKKLGEKDPANAERYAENARTYNEKIRTMQREAGEAFREIPREKRVLVTGHDAFNYLGKTFDLDIHATDFVSSEAQMSAQQMDELATLVARKKVGVIFQDNLSNPDAIKHLQEAVHAKGGEVKVSDKPLYADSLGESAPTDTYLGAFRYNVDTIVAAMKGRS